MTESNRRPIRIAGCSGAASDRRHALSLFASNYPNDPVDVIHGDFLSEANMKSRGASKASSQLANGALTVPAYEPSFLDSLEPALADIAKYGIRVACNAGASDTELLAKAVQKMVEKHGLKLKVAWVSGDEVLPAVQAALKEERGKLLNMYSGEILEDWRFEPAYAQAYLGGLGIAEAFASGADIVVSGRTSDASPVIGAAYWWHGWTRKDLRQLANAFIAGHLTECSTYVTGGNFSGFKSLEANGWHDMGFPIAEISGDGQAVITKSKGSGGVVSVDTCTAQLVYEIQGPWYFNSDVTAVVSDIWFEQVSTDRVAIHGVGYDLPPPTTKVGITGKAGFKAEIHWFLCGLDIEAKARMIETQIRHLMKSYIHQYSSLAFTTNGSAAENPRTQNAATVDLRVYAQAKEEEWLKPKYFLNPCFDVIMQAFPGATPHLDPRMGLPKAANEYWVTLMPQSELKHRIHLWDGRILDIAPPDEKDTKTYSKLQPDQPATSSTTEINVGKTTKGPLGWLVHARSGDKANDANVGLWVRHEDEWEWLRRLLSTDYVKLLLADDYNGKKIERFELPHMRAVHFLLRDHLDRGVASYDFLGKNVAEYLRSKHVDLPLKFLERGKI